MEQSGAEIIVQCLAEAGVRVVAGMPGGANLPLYDALARSGLRHVLVRHEQAAGFIAQGMARTSGGAGVCFATSGPGATNLVTALADAHRDSVPVVAITGQVPTALLGTDAFQEVDTPALVGNIVKRAVQIRRPEELWHEVPAALRLAESGRPGPVLIDVPKDVQVQSCARPPEAARAGADDGAKEGDLSGAVAEAVAYLEAAERPVVLAGGGLVLGSAHRELYALSERQDLPVTATLMGLGVLDPDDPRWLGMLGMHGAPYTNRALREADLLVVLGARFDDRATGKLAEFCPQARVLHVDVDARELGKLRRAELAVRADVGAFLRQLLPVLPRRARRRWRERVAELRHRHPLPVPADEATGRAVHLLRALAHALPADATLTTDVGQHQMWVAQHVPVRRPRGLLTSGGLGTMGFGLPAAIGSALVRDAPVVCVTGDGSLLLSIAELATLAELELDVRIVLFDNRHLGLVRQQQDLFYAGRHSAARFERAVDFVTVARGLGVNATRVEPGPDSRADLGSALQRPGPHLIHVPIDPREHVLPMVPPGAANHEMLGERATSPPADGS